MMRLSCHHSCAAVTVYQSSSLINIDLNGITRPLLLIHLKVDIDFLLLCQWEHTPLSLSFYLTPVSLSVAGFLPFRSLWLSFTLLHSPSFSSSLLFPFAPHADIRLSHALCLILCEHPRWSSKCFSVFFFSRQILSRAVWTSAVTSLVTSCPHPHPPPPAPTPYLPHFSPLSPDKGLSCTFSFRIDSH